MSGRRLTRFGDWLLSQLPFFGGLWSAVQGDVAWAVVWSAMWLVWTIKDAASQVRETKYTLTLTPSSRRFSGEPS